MFLQEASVHLSVPLVDNLDRGNPLFLVKRTVVTSGTVIDAE